MIDIRRCSVAELEAAPNLDELLAEYAFESSMPEIGTPNPQFEVYRRLEANNAFYPLGAFDHGYLVGFILPIVTILPHYGVLAAVVESFFVTQAFRSTGAGLQLLACAEGVARALGAKALLLSAPVGSALAQVLPHRRYRHSNNVFVRALT